MNVIFSFKKTGNSIISISQFRELDLCYFLDSRNNLFVWGCWDLKVDYGEGKRLEAASTCSVFTQVGLDSLKMFGCLDSGTLRFYQVRVNEEESSFEVETFSKVLLLQGR